MRIRTCSVLVCFMGLVSMNCSSLWAAPEDESQEVYTQVLQEVQNEPNQLSSPTIPFPPPIEPFFYNGSSARERENLGRSLSSALAVCGDGVYDPGEDCDDGNRTIGDGCSDLCRLEDLLACGNGAIDSGESCDDGNAQDGDGCSATCQFEGICGDGLQDAGEQCDDGNSKSGDGCSSRCLYEKIEDIRNVELESDKKSGSRNSEIFTKLNADEKTKNQLVSDGTEKAPDKLNQKAQVFNLKTCGNGIVERGEACDDGNSKSGDGCSSSCDVEYVSGNKVTEYKAGKAITSPPGCSAQCEYAYEYQDGNLVRSYEVLGKRKITGGTYFSQELKAEVSCSTGQISSTSANNYEATGGGIAQITGCSPPV